MVKSTPKILFFATHFYPYKGGLENYVLEVAKLLAKKTQVGVVALKHKPLPDKSTYKGIDIHRLESTVLLPGVYEIPKSSKKNRQTLSKLMKEYDVIITQTRFFSTSFLGALLSKIYNKQYIHTEHGNVFVKHDNKIVELAARLMDETFGRFVFKSSDITIGISKPCEMFAKRMGAKKTKLIYNGINFSMFKQPTKTIRNKLILKYNPNKKKIVIFFGRLIYAKGVQDLIKACKNLEVRLFIIGDGPYKKELEHFVKQSKVDAKFFGQKSREDIIQLLSISDVFVNPSFSEGLPTSVLEAAAMNVPIIATDVGGTNEIVKQGILIQPQDVVTLNKSLKKYLKNKPKTKEDLTQFDMRLIAQEIYKLI
jgi:glycosyltransferase involved in cell wall biosynthesis